MFSQKSVPIIDIANNESTVPSETEKKYQAQINSIITLDSARDRQNKSSIVKIKSIADKTLESDTSKQKSVKVKHHPRINSPISNIFDDKALKSGNKPREYSEKKVSKQFEENFIDKSTEKNIPSEKRKDDNASISSLEYFNITNFGRIRPAKRESLIQILNLQNFVQDQLKNVEKMLDFHGETISHDADLQDVEVKKKREGSKARNKTLDILDPISEIESKQNIIEDQVKKPQNLTKSK